MGGFIGGKLSLLISGVRTFNPSKQAQHPPSSSVLGIRLKMSENALGYTVSAIKASWGQLRCRWISGSVEIILAEIITP